MNRTALVVSMTLTALAAGGCATMSESECHHADWYAIGYEDGIRGQTPERVGAHRKACAQYDITPDIERYKAGRRDGLKEYCTVSKGLAVGRTGVPDPTVCPTEMEADFLTGYALGNDIYKVEHALQHHQNQIDQITEQLAHDELPSSDRRQLVSELRGLEREYGRLEAELTDLERNADRLRF